MDVQLIDGDLPARPTYIDGADLVAQRIAIRLQTWRGEWLLDAAQGIDYLSLLEQKPVDTDAVGDLFRAEILGVSGVDRVEDLTVTFDIDARRLSLSGTVVVASETLELSGAVPFAIGGLGNANAAVTLRRLSGPFLS